MYGQQTIKVEKSNRSCDNDVHQVMNVLTQMQEEYKSSGKVLGIQIIRNFSIMLYCLCYYSQSPCGFSHLQLQITSVILDNRVLNYVKGEQTAGFSFPMKMSVMSQFIVTVDN